MSWLNPTVEDRDYIDRLKQRGDTLFPLLRVLSLALWIEPLLLRNARLQFTPAADIELEADIWFSDVMHTNNAKACVMRSGIARALADDLALDPEQYEAAWQFVQNHTRHWSMQDQLEQELRLAARNEDSSALQKGFNRILKTLLNTEDSAAKRDLSRWIKGAMPSLIKTDEMSETAHLLFQYTAAALGLPSAWSNEVQTNKASMPQWLVDALPECKQYRIGIQLRKGLLECLDPDSARHTLELNLPLPTPVLLTVNGNRQGSWEPLWIGKKIELYRRIQSLTLQTLDGKIFRFSVASDENREIDQEDPPSAAVLLAYMPNEIELAQQIAKILRQNDIDVELAEDRPPRSGSVIASDRPLLRLWSKASSAYWQRALQETLNSYDNTLAKGLLLRTEPGAELPGGASSSRSFELIDWKNSKGLIAPEQLVSKVLTWIDTGVLDSPPDDITVENEIEALLKELKNPETRPRRRLEIGDRLAELGDPRKGVGVREYQVIEYSTEVQKLLNELDDITTEPPRRLEIGDHLDQLGDPRPGVGLDESGVPDIDWIEIPAGAFIYGEQDRQQKRELENFYISRYPITNRQYQAFIEAGGYEDKRWWQDLIKPEPQKPEWKPSNRPRESVDWYEAVAFTRWLSTRLDYSVTLPTEQQWEKAARGADGRAYPWGNEYRSGFANVDETENKNGPYYLRETAAAGLYPQGHSPYGVADLAGNVWEWCLTKYDKPTTIDIDTSDDWRVLRGGSWIASAEYARASYRRGFNPVLRNRRLGFRVVSLSPFTDL